MTVTKQFAPSEYLIDIDIVLAAMRETNAFGSNDWATMARLNSSKRCLYTPCRRVAWHAPPNEVAGLAKWEILKQVDDRVAELSDVRVESCGLRMQSDLIESPNPLEVEDVVRRTTCASRPGLAMPRAIGRPGSGACTMVSQQEQIDGSFMAATKQLAPGEHLIGIGVVLASDARNGGVRQQRLGHDGQLELFSMVLVNQGIEKPNQSRRYQPANM